MENLSERFNALQEQLMNIYEAAEQTLKAQILHWQTLRKEAVTLYFARQKGINRLGYQPVPALAISEARAKEAIYMVLQLESLQKSAFALEPWTLVDTSAETFKSAPENHFKKGPVPVEVIFDKDEANANLYTMWTFVYYMDSDDVWHKTTSGVNQTGIYYLYGTFKHYYVLFADDAKRYSATGEWEVKVNKETVFTPVTSSTPPGSPGGQTDPDTSSKTPTTITAATDTSPRRQSISKQSQQTETKRRGYGRRPSSRTRRPQTHQRRSRSRSRSRSSSQTHSSTTTTTTYRSRSTSLSKTRAHSRSRSTSRSTSTTSRRGGRGSPTRQRSRSPSTYSYTSKRSREGNTRGRGRGRQGRAGSSGGREQRRRRRSFSTSPDSSKRARRESPKFRGVSPSEVGKQLRSVGAKHSGRLGRLLEEARDPPVILVRGDANTLKCFRNRAKSKYRGLFRSFSTTFSWVAGDSIERLGRSRMLISFSCLTQRRDFDDAVKYPKGVDWSYGSLDSL